MGWSCERFNKYFDKETDIIERAIGIGQDDGRERSIAAKGRYGNTYYYAIRYKPEGQDNFIVFGLVVLTSKRDGEICYKFVDETMGPCNYNAPQKVLNVLTDTDSDYANKWRDDCWLWHKTKREFNSLMKIGNSIKVLKDLPYKSAWGVDMTIPNGSIISVFKHGKGKAISYKNRIYSLPRMSSMDYFELVVDK